MRVLVRSEPGKKASDDHAKPAIPIASDTDVTTKTCETDLDIQKGDVTTDAPAFNRATMVYIVAHYPGIQDVLFPWRQLQYGLRQCPAPWRP